MQVSLKSKISKRLEGKEILESDIDLLQDSKQQIVTKIILTFKRTDCIFSIVIKEMYDNDASWIVVFV